MHLHLGEDVEDAPRHARDLRVAVLKERLDERQQRHHAVVVCFIGRVAIVDDDEFFRVFLDESVEDVQPSQQPLPLRAVVGRRRVDAAQDVGETADTQRSCGQQRPRNNNVIVQWEISLYCAHI